MSYSADARCNVSVYTTFYCIQSYRYAVMSCCVPFVVSLCYATVLRDIVHYRPPCSKFMYMLRHLINCRIVIIIIIVYIFREITGHVWWHFYGENWILILNICFL